MKGQRIEPQLWAPKIPSFTNSLAIKAMYAIKTKKSVKLPVQEVVDNVHGLVDNVDEGC